MTNNIKSSIYFSRVVQSTGNGIALTNPFRVIVTPFMPTLLTIGITFIITGLDNNLSQTFQVELKSKDSGVIIYKSKEQKFTYIDPYNTIITINLDSAQFNQTTGGDYEVSIEIRNNDKEQIFLGKETLTIIKTN